MRRIWRCSLSLRAPSRSTMRSESSPEWLLRFTSVSDGSFAYNHKNKQIVIKTRANNTKQSNIMRTKGQLLFFQTLHFLICTCNIFYKPFVIRLDIQTSGCYDSQVLQKIRPRRTELKLSTTRCYCCNLSIAHFTNKHQEPKLVED